MSLNSFILRMQLLWGLAIVNNYRTRTDKPRTGTTALMSERSKRVLDDSQQLLKSIQLRHRPHPGEGLSSSMSMTAMNGSIPRSTAEIQADATRLRIRAQRSLSPEPSEPAACAESGGMWGFFNAIDKGILFTPYLDVDIYWIHLVFRELTSMIGLKMNFPIANLLGSSCKKKSNLRTIGIL